MGSARQSCLGPHPRHLPIRRPESPAPGVLLSPAPTRPAETAAAAPNAGGHRFMPPRSCTHTSSADLYTGAANVPKKRTRESKMTDLAADPAERRVGRHPGSAAAVVRL